MKKMTALLAGAALMLAASSAMAITFNPNLTRPVTVNAGSGSENSLQTELNAFFGGGVDVTNDQLGVGMYKISTIGSGTITPQLVFEWTANAGTQTVGIFSWNGTNTIESTIFLGDNQPGSTAKLTWNSQNSGKISLFDSADTFLGQTIFSGINRDSFGFFFKPNGEQALTYYTVDSLNPNGEARVLAYDGSEAGISNSGILFAYEDGSDWDYQDAGFFVESIAPVPEPGTMMLLGAGFLGLAIYGKRRKNA